MYTRHSNYNSGLVPASASASASAPEREPVLEYAELHCLSNFTFLRGGSHPHELAERAARLGYSAIALTDECSLAGVVRAHLAVKAANIACQSNLHFIVGAEFVVAPREDVAGDSGAVRLVCLATNRDGYANLCALITKARRNAQKGQYCLDRAFFDGGLPGCLVLYIPDHDVWRAAYRSHAQAPRLESNLFDVYLPDTYLEQAQWVRTHFPKRSWIGVELSCAGDDVPWLQCLRTLGQRSALPLVAAGNVHMHARSRRPVQDVLSAIRLKCPVSEVGFSLHPNGERHLRSRGALAQLYPRALLQQSVLVAARCQFSLDVLRYEYPSEVVPAEHSGASYLRLLTEQGLKKRWPNGASAKVKELVEHELALIAELSYEPYFLTVYDIVRFARTKGILCQGRGSAANSAVCYCLGITEVDPARMATLFERFISRERDEPPDIDVDFEHERREEVIQYIYRKYGRDRAALAAAVITYRPRSAIRDVGKALGLSLEQVDRLAKSMAWWDGHQVIRERLRDVGLDPENPVVIRLALLVDVVVGFPRHLSQHVGGFVISQGPLSQMVPVENAAMPERTIIEWDKDDLEAMGLLKVDVLALGMLTAIRKALVLVSAYRGQTLTLANVPAEDPQVYAMMQRADTVGVFQIESRAQMAMLPRLRPRTFYDLVVEVAIVRPGPIQGGMVHPYLRRRQGIEAVTYPSPAVQAVLERTLGIPIFQEQVMQLAVVAAGFTPGEADGLRRAMAAWRRKGGLDLFEERLATGMRERGYSEQFAQQIFKQIQGFGDYGFPESHSASFALLVYISAWLKCHEPAAFTCALLNSQPMGFYAPAQLVRDAKQHEVEVRSVDVMHSEWDCTLEPGAQDAPALRLGLRMIKGLREDDAGRIYAMRSTARWDSVAEFARASGLSRATLERLAHAGALKSLAGHRHQAQWAVLGIETMSALLETTGIREPAPEQYPTLPVPTKGQDLVADYATTGLTLGEHPLALLRGRFNSLARAGDVHTTAHGEYVRAVGLVIGRQRPSTASGVIFMTLEDETGLINVVIWPWVMERQRREVLSSRLVEVSGVVEREREVVHLIAGRLTDHTPLLGALETHSRDFH
ncbi:MAG: error-prone DNA polymerase [Gammaproteobacteria bacterium]|jgi:error-prone DNA polymerase